MLRPYAPPNNHWRRRIVLGLLVFFPFWFQIPLQWAEDEFETVSSVTVSSSSAPSASPSSASSTAATFVLPANHSPTQVVVSTEGKNGPLFCQCELVSVDCLHAMACIPTISEEETAAKQVARGVMIRQLLREMTMFSGLDETDAKVTIGKGVQYAAVRSWRSWTRGNQLPEGFLPHDNAFINESAYPYCKKHDLIGKNCFFRPPFSQEDLDDLELEAMQQHAPFVHNETKAMLRKELLRYQEESRLRSHDAGIPALQHLSMFAHILRLRFNRQPPVRDFYAAHLDGIQHYSTKEQIHGKRLRVSLHMRRADACAHRLDGYETRASELNSGAQVGNRLCYATSVYMQGLRRIQESSALPLEVYLSTDYQRSVLKEIASEHPDLYRNISWKFLNYSRELFDYKEAETIDDHDHVKNIATIGESSVADLWLLSHGQVFVGHLGSRFGKVGWLLATARHNHFVPYWTVDGHSVCCEIDEACGQMKPFIDSMENCLTYQHEVLPVKINEDYWEVGSMVRKIVVELERNHTEVW